MHELIADKIDSFFSIDIFELMIIGWENIPPLIWSKTNSTEQGQNQYKGESVTPEKNHPRVESIVGQGNPYTASLLDQP